MRFELVTLLSAAFLLCGCATIHRACIPGSFEEGNPKLSRKFERGRKVMLAFPYGTLRGRQHERSFRQISDEFERALRVKGFDVFVSKNGSVDKRDILAQAAANGCTEVFVLRVQSWEYSDHGFFSREARNDIAISVVIYDVKSGYVASRVDISVRSDWEIFDEFVSSIMDKAE